MLSKEQHLREEKASVKEHERTLLRFLQRIFLFFAMLQSPVFALKMKIRNSTIKVYSTCKRFMNFR